MREAKLVSRYRGIGDVVRRKNSVARVRYDVRCRRMVGTARVGEERLEEAPVQPMIDGSIQVLGGETSLYTDELYTLRLEAKHQRECDFYTAPIDVVAGTYYIEGSGDFRNPCYGNTRNGARIHNHIGGVK